MPIDPATHTSRSDKTLEDLVAPFLVGGTSLAEQYDHGVLHRAAVQRYLDYLGTLDQADVVQSITTLLFELSATAAFLARAVSPKRPAQALADLRSALNHHRNLTPLQTAQLLESLRNRQA
ncbi:MULTISPECIES: hypothetical protein [unclassified Streptomyces]|uniref:hypothetical protein n=1 Tax=unclassified Streptomyces TaxID=2593676 RepID=UPI00364A2EE9